MKYCTPAYARLRTGIADWADVRNVPFLVDRRKHRIVKREGVWRMYCPKRGPNSIIFTIGWDYVLEACLTPCPHDEIFWR